MQRPYVLIRFGTIAVVVCLFSLLAWSGPFLPQPENLPGTVVSLAGIDEITLEIVPFPRELADIGINAESTRKAWGKRLEDAGIKVQKDTDGPRLRLVVVTATEEDVPDAVLSFVFLSFNQTMRSERLDRMLIVPTYAHPIAGLESRTGLGKAVRENLEELIEDFVTDVKKANDQMKEEGDRR